MRCMTFLCIIVLWNKTVAHTFLSSFNNANGLFQEIFLTCIDKFCYHGNVMSHFSPLLCYTM